MWNKKWNIAIALGTLWLFAIVVAIAQTTANTPKQQQDKLGLGTDQVRQLLLLMDTDKNGKISRQEYMKFMSDEFDRLDTDKSGELDVNELKQSRLQVRPFSAVGK